MQSNFLSLVFALSLHYTSNGPYLFWAAGLEFNHFQIDFRINVVVTASAGLIFWQ